MTSPRIVTSEWGTRGDDGKVDEDDEYVDDGDEDEGNEVNDPNSDS
jgi:hypothetical protein